jgi:hypothetical protein
VAINFDLSSLERLFLSIGAFDFGALLNLIKYKSLHIDEYNLSILVP